MIERSLSSFIFTFLNFFVYLCAYLFIYISFYLFIIIIIIFGGYKDISHLFINMADTPPVWKERVHTGRPHTRIDNGRVYSDG